MNPPDELDGAKVLEWAWSEVPFGVIRYTDGTLVCQLHGLAICQYSQDKKVYGFSCDSEWEVQQDMDYRSIEEAKELLPAEYEQVDVVWHMNKVKARKQHMEINLMEIEPELRDPIPRPMRWEFQAHAGEDYRREVTRLLQHGIATRARILQCEWFDDGRTDEIGPSIRARYEYYDRDKRRHVKTFEGSYDGWHLGLSPTQYYTTLLRTWRVGGYVTVLYPDTNPLDSRLYFDMPIELVSPPPAKQTCPCCGHQTLEAHEFAPCPHCGHLTVKKATVDNSCRVCGWVTGGENPVSVERGRENYKLFGRCDESRDYWYWEQPQPFPEEITAPRFVPPHIWLVSLSPDTNVDGIIEALQPFFNELKQGWQLLISQYQTSKKHPPTTWWNMYYPQEVGFIAWRSSFEEALSSLELPDKAVDNLCNALVEGLMPRNYILDTTLLKKYEPIADWSYWFLIIDKRYTIECRFGKLKPRW